jgi:hypothetical protein
MDFSEIYSWKSMLKLTRELYFKLHQYNIVVSQDYIL